MTHRRRSKSFTLSRKKGNLHFQKEKKKKHQVFSNSKKAEKMTDVLTINITEETKLNNGDLPYSVKGTMEIGDKKADFHLSEKSDHTLLLTVHQIFIDIWGQSMTFPKNWRMQQYKNRQVIDWIQRNYKKILFLAGYVNKKITT